MINEVIPTLVLLALLTIALIILCAYSLHKAFDMYKKETLKMKKRGSSAGHIELLRVPSFDDKKLRLIEKEEEGGK